MHLQSITALLSDLRIALIAERPREALRRISLFELMYLSEPEESREEMENRQRLVLRIETGEIIVCDEYYPQDQGRVHMIPAHRYGNFNPREMTLEFAKVTMDVSEIIFEEAEWPSELPNNSHSAVLAYFTGNYQ